MKIYEGHNNEGDLIYFEVPNSFLSRKTAIKIIKDIPNAEVLKVEIREDVFCTFQIGNRVFEIIELFGDSSRFHIGEQVAKKSNELQIIKQIFSAHKLGLLSILGR